MEQVSLDPEATRKTEIMEIAEQLEQAREAIDKGELSPEEVRSLVIEMGELKGMFDAYYSRSSNGKAPREAE